MAIAKRIIDGKRCGKLRCSRRICKIKGACPRLRIKIGPNIDSTRRIWRSRGCRKRDATDTGGDQTAGIDLITLEQESAWINDLVLRIQMKLPSSRRERRPGCVAEDEKSITVHRQIQCVARGTERTLAEVPLHSVERDTQPGRQRSPPPPSEELIRSAKTERLDLNPTVLRFAILFPTTDSALPFAFSPLTPVKSDDRIPIGTTLLFVIAVQRSRTDQSTNHRPEVWPALLPCVHRSR